MRFSDIIFVNVDDINCKMRKFCNDNNFKIKRFSHSENSFYIEAKHNNYDKIFKIRISNHKNCVPYNKQKFTLIDISPFTHNLNSAILEIKNIVK